MQHIIVATDGSPGANRALDAAARLAKALGAELIILTVGGNLTGAELRQLASVDGNASEALESAAKRVLNLAKKRAGRCGAGPIKLQIGWGDPTEAIMESVRREKADILVVGRRGRGQLSGLLLGSVSQKLVSLAPCNVMVVP